ncbi:MAG: hypothetical protein GY845_29330 [Planctomycetes bacterium]|nr:hypothetical protein [Planctomycetota bacterium]
MVAKQVEILIFENKWDQISSMGAIVVPRLTEELKTGDDYTRYRSAKLLGEMSVYHPLIEALGDPYYDVRRISASHLTGAEDSFARLCSGLFVGEYNEDMIQETDRFNMLIRALKLGYEVGSSAARILGRSGDRRAVDYLLEALDDPSGRTYPSIIEALANLGDVRAADKLVKLYKRFLHPDRNKWYDIERDTWDGISHDCADAFSLAWRKLDDPRARLCKNLANYDYSSPDNCDWFDKDDQAQIDMMIELGIGYYRYHILRAFAQTRCKKAVPALIQLLQVIVDECKENIVIALGEIRDERAIEPLISLVFNKNCGWRVMVLSLSGALRNFDDTRAEIFSELLSSHDDLEPVVEKCRPHVDLLIDILDRTIDFVEETGARKQLMCNVISVLGKIGEKRVIPVLLSSLQYPEEEVRRDAAIALGLINDERTIELLIKKLRDDLKENVRSAAAEALERFDTPKARFNIELYRGNYKQYVEQGSSMIGELIETVSSGSGTGKEIYCSAIKALGEIGSRLAVPVLTKSLKYPMEVVRCEAAAALGLINDESAVKPLIEVIREDIDKDVRSAAARALAKFDTARVRFYLQLYQGNYEQYVKQGSSQIESLAEALGSGLGMEVNTSAANALGEIGDKKAVEYILEMLNTRIKTFELRKLHRLDFKPHAEEEYKWTLRHSLDEEGKYSTIHDSDEDRLMATLYFTRKATIAAITSLRMIQDSRAVEPLIKIVRLDIDDEIRRIAAEALGASDDMRARFYSDLYFGDYGKYTQKGVIFFDLLLEALASDERMPGREVIISSAKALGEIGDTRAVEPLISLCEFHGSCAVEALGNIGDERAVGPLLKRRYRESYDIPVALGKIGDERAVEPLIEDLKTNRLYLDGNRSKEDAGKLSKACSCIVEALARIGDRRCVAAIFNELGTKHCGTTALKILKEHADPSTQKLIGAVTRILSEHPFEWHQRLLAGIGSSIHSYVNKFNLSEDPSAAYERITSLVKITHDNAPLCLESLVNIGVALKNIRELIETIPINNPLTRIIRMLGEPRNTIAGYRDVTLAVVEKGTFENLYKLIIEIAKTKHRASPQEVAGILDVLRGYIGSGQFNNWGDHDWEIFSANIQDYYNSGFKVVTANFFNYFTEHKDDTVALSTLKGDIEKELSRLCWGSYYGLSKELTTKYNLGMEDEIAILGRCVHVSNYTGKDYVGEYKRIKSALEDMPPSRWRKEVPSELRGLYSFKGSKSVVTYFGDRQELQKLIGENGLPSYVTTTNLTIEDIITYPNCSDKEIKRFILGAVLGEEGKEFFAAIPHGDVEQRDWLSGWYTLIEDDIKQEYKNILAQMIYQALQRLGMGISDVEAMLVRSGFQLVSVADKEKLFKVDKDIKDLVKKSKYAKLSEYFIEKWLSRVTHTDVMDETVFSAWIDSGLSRFVRQVARKAGMKTDDISMLKIRETLVQAREEYTERGILEFRANQYTHQLLDVFKDDLSMISLHRNCFNEMSVDSKEDLYVGFFDDLLHLAGEFMLSGVCTWSDRSRQISEGKDEGYHFGTIALKDSTGRVHGFSQVQLLGTPIEGVKSIRRKHKTLCLTGLNLGGTSLPVSRDKAVMVILKVAFELAKEAGMQHAVIVQRDDIHSNQTGVKEMIKKLVEQKHLIKGKLVKEVRLSESPEYKYQDIYIINDLPSIELTPTTIDKTYVKALKEEELLEKNHVSVFDGFCYIRHTDDSPEEIAVLKSNVEKTLWTMPKAIVGDKDMLGDVAMNLQRMGSSIVIVHDSGMTNSSISKSDEEITLYLGKDIMYDKGKIESLGLRSLIAEVITSVILEDYQELKKKAYCNENAFFKLELIKALLNYRAYIPFYFKTCNRYAWTIDNYWDEKDITEQRTVISQCLADLDKYTKKWREISQFNIFINVMDDADPVFLVHNFLHILLSRNSDISAQNITHIIYAIACESVLRRESIANIRNIYKDFILNGKVHLKILSEIQEKENFSNFDDTLHLRRMHDEIVDADTPELFYDKMRKIIELLLPPLDKEQLSNEISRLIDSGQHEQYSQIAVEEREEFIRDLLKELLIRRIGGTAYNAVFNHLTGNVTTPEEQPEEDKDVDMPDELDAAEEEPAQFIKVLVEELEHGEDADNYLSMLSEPDWVFRLFKMRDDE